MARKRRPEPAPAVLPAAATPVHASRRPLWWGALLLLAVAVAVALGLWLARSPAQAPTPTPIAAAPAAPTSAQYVANAQCLGCHPAAAQAWLPSHHAKAMAPADAQSVRGNFDNAQFKHQGISTRLFRRDGKYMVHTDGADGRMADFEVKYSFGVEPLQQYLIETEGGRLQPLQIAWNTRDGKWFHLLPNEKAPAGDVLHWTGRYQTANTMCIACHTTGFDKRYDAQADRFDSHWREPNVSCQSCHGPGSRHVAWAQAPGAASAPQGLLADLKTPRSQVEVCSGCHSRRAELTAQPVPGQPHLDHYLPSLLREGLYHADGQQLDEVFVGGSYRQSKMYRMGVACSHCHDPHSAKPRLQGNALCTQCHQPQPNPAFPSAAGAYDTPQHHHHPQGSRGASCTACHMPAKNYMIVQPRPDHSLRIPRPDLSVTLGTPNACNQCHAEQSAQWAADAVTKWAGSPKRPPHYGEVFAAARRGASGSPQALAALAALAGDKAQPAIVRATAIDLLRGDAAVGIDQRIAATHETDAELRAAAAASLELLPASLRVPTLAPLLRDPVRAVRIAAARSLASLPAAQFAPATRAAFDAALAEYIAAQEVALDMPGNQLNLAVLYALTGRDELAEAHYLKALRIDPDFTPARANLAQFYSGRSRNADAERVLREGLQRLPQLGELQYSLGLLLAEDQRLPEAADALDKAAKLLPQRARVHYNLGLALQQLGQTKPAEAALLQAQRVDTRDPAIAYALAVLYAQRGQRAQALAAARTLQALQPGDPQVEQLLQRLQHMPP